MGGTAVTRPTVDFRDVQGLVRFGYKHLKAARYAVVRVRNPAAARAWLRQAPVTNAEYVQPPPPVGAARGPHRGRPRRARRAGGRPGRVFARVPRRHGGRATAPAVSATWAPTRPRGGDGAAAPASPHLLVMFFTRGADTLDGVRRAHRRAPRSPTRSTCGRCSRRRISTAIEPFGFADGMSQPAIDWEQETDPDSRSTRLQQRRGARRVRARVRERVRQVHGPPGRQRGRGQRRAARRPPTIPARRTWAGTARTSCSGSSARTCAAFWQFVHGATGGEPAAMDRLSSAFVGRTRTGEPLVTAARDARATVEPFHLRRRPARRRVSGRARTSVERTRATPTIRAARPAWRSCWRRSERRARDSATTWCRRCASIACCGADASTARRCRQRMRCSRRRPTIPSAGCTSCASTPTSGASSSSCRTPG